MYKRVCAVVCVCVCVCVRARREYVRELDFEIQGSSVCLFPTKYLI